MSTLWHNGFGFEIKVVKSKNSYGVCDAKIWLNALLDAVPPPRRRWLELKGGDWRLHCTTCSVLGSIL